nr:DUF3037 domain-containing protein [Streptomyces sp. JJ66]
MLPEVTAIRHAVESVCRGGADAGQAAGEDAGRRFRWLIAPRSTVVQPGPVHTGLTADPRAEAEHLLDVLVRTPRRGAPRTPRAPGQG